MFFHEQEICNNDPELVLILREYLAAGEDLLAAAELFQDKTVKPGEIKSIDEKFQAIEELDAEIRVEFQSNEYDDELKDSLKKKFTECAKLSRDLAKDLRSLLEV